MKRLTLEEFGGDDYSQSFGLETYSAIDKIDSIKYNYQKYLKLTDEEIERFHKLAEHVGEDVLLDRGRAGKSKMYIVCVHLTPDMKHPDPRPYDQDDNPPRYKAEPYFIRLNYRDHLTNKDREWDGIWVKNPMKITLESEILELFEHGK